VHGVGLHLAQQQGFLGLARQHLRLVEGEVARHDDLAGRHELVALAVMHAEGQPQPQPVLARAALGVHRQDFAFALLAEHLEHRLGLSAVGDHARAGASLDVARQFRAERRVRRKSEEKGGKGQRLRAAQAKAAGDQAAGEAEDGCKPSDGRSACEWVVPAKAGSQLGLAVRLRPGLRRGDGGPKRPH